jgi:hypothetical protein
VHLKKNLWKGAVAQPIAAQPAKADA